MSRHTRSIPILVDSSLNRAIGIKYVIYAVFGLTGIFTHIPSVAELTGAGVATVMAVLVMVFATSAAIGAFKSIQSERWERVELHSTIALISFVSVYNFSLIYLAITGSEGRVNLAVLATALLVMPIWRVRYIIRKSRKRP